METRDSTPPAATELAGSSQKRLAEYLSFFALAVPAAGAILLSGYVFLFLLAQSNARPEPHITFWLLLLALGLVLLVLTGRMQRHELSAQC
jgi:hypothetical protein